MIHLQKRSGGFSVQRFLLLILFTAFFAGCSLTDNATRLANQLESAAGELSSKQDGSELVIHYKPDDNNTAFTILIIPGKGTTSSELYQKGLNSNIVEHLFDLKNMGSINVYQDGIISNTTYHLRFVDVAATQIIKGSGNTDLIVKKIGTGSSRLSKDLVLFELKKAGQ